MASMQIVGGAGNTGSGKAGNSGGLDPLLMGVSSEAAAVSGSASDGSEQEHPFASELAAALASLDAEQTAALAENLLDGALQEGQIIDPTALISATGQKLPTDPAFQNAVLASFAALNGALTGQELVTGAQAEDLVVAQGQAINVIVPLSVTGQIPASGVQAEDGTSQLLGGITGAGSAPNLLAVKSQSMTGDQAISPNALASSTDGADVSAAVGIQTSSELLGKLKPQATEAGTQSQTSSGAGSALTAGTDVLLNRSASQSGTQGQSQSGSSQDQAAAATAAALADAARARMEKESSEYAGKQTSLTGSPVNDVGNVVVTAKPNAEGVAAAADAARQSAQRIESSAAAGAQSTGQSSAEALARAESKLEAARASLGTGPLNVEILKLTRQGGGRAVLEVTPPNQGPIRIDLQLDGAGKANLVVEGLSDSMKARLESSAHFLRQDMAQMGLALNLEMRERNESGASAQAFAQGQFGQSGQGGTRESAANGSRGSEGVSAGQAGGNVAVAQRSTAVDDGIHLVA